MTTLMLDYNREILVLHFQLLVYDSVMTRHMANSGKGQGCITAMMSDVLSLSKNRSLCQKDLSYDRLICDQSADADLFDQHKWISSTN